MSPGHGDHSDDWKSYYILLPRNLYYPSINQNLPSVKNLTPSDLKKMEKHDASTSVDIPHGEPLRRTSPPFLCGFTESYKDLLMDTRQWLENSHGEIPALLLIKLFEQRTASIPPPLCLDDLAEDDNYRPRPGEPGYESGDIDPAYEPLRESTKTEDWVGSLSGFAELWCLNRTTSTIERDGGRVVSAVHFSVPVQLTTAAC